jgi:uncharacterized protein
MALRIALFIVIITSFVGLTHYYVWARLVRDPELSPAWATAGRAVLALLAVILVAGFVASRGPRAIAVPVAWVGFVWLGVLFYFLVVFGLADLARAVLWGVRHVVGDDPPDPARRVAVARLLAGVAGALTLGASGTALAGGVRAVGVKTVRISLPKLPRDLDGYRIVQISDVHVGPTIGRAFFDDMIDKINALSPDLVAITGDLVDGSVAELGELVRPLQRIRAKDGVFFVTGNHEYYSGAEEWMRFLETLGIRVLRNERVRVRGDAGFDLAGVHDYGAAQFGPGPDLKKALAGRDPSRALVLLAHQPRHVLEAAKLGTDLQLSGHTHGGQLWPWRYMVYLQQPYVEGLHRHDQAQIYVSRGTGYWGPPMRLLAPAEITNIELTV